MPLRDAIAAQAVLDSLDRSEDPLAAGWLKPSWVGSIGKCSATTCWTHAVAFATDEGGAYWGSESFTASGNTYISTVASLTTDVETNERWFALWACLDPAKQSGYRMKCVRTADEVYTVTIEKVVEGTPETIATVAGVTIQENTSRLGGVALVVGNGQVQVFTRVAATGATFARVLTVKDSTFTSGYSGMESKGAGWGLGDFRADELKVSGMDPTELSATRLWLDAKDLGWIADGTIIEIWGDNSGRGNHVTNVTGGQQPVVKLNILNGLPVVRFTNDVLRQLNFSPTELEGATIFMVYTIRANAGSFKRLISFTPTSGSNDYEKGLAVDLGEKSRAVDDYLNVIGKKSAVENIDSKTSSHALGTFSRVTIDYFDDVTTRLWVDGIAEGTRAADSDKIETTQFRLGKGRFSNTEPTGPEFDVAELIITEEALSTADREGIEKYLYDKWGVGEPVEGEEEATEYVRRFAAGDSITFAAGDISGERPSVLALLTRIEAAPAGNTVLWGAYESGEARHVIGINKEGQLFYEKVGEDVASIMDYPFSDHWCLIVVDVSGIGKVTVRVYDFTAEEWVIDEVMGEVSGLAAGIDEVIVGKDAAGERSVLAFDIAAAAAWSGSLVGTEVADFVNVADLRDWLDFTSGSPVEEAPDALWLFEQSSVSESVSDETGNGASQTERSGTEALKNDPPIPYGEAGKFVNVLVGGVLTKARRWVKVGGELLNI